MRLHSYYEVTCARCENSITTEDTEGTCPVCFTPFKVVWQAAYKPKKEEDSNAPVPSGASQGPTGQK